MALTHLVRKQQDRFYYPKHFRQILSVLWLTLLINIALVPILIVLYFSQNNPLYYANSFDGHVTPIAPIANYVVRSSTDSQPTSGI